MILGRTIDNHNVSIDLDRLVEGRLMLQANSGAGKSWALRRHHKPQAYRCYGGGDK